MTSPYHCQPLFSPFCFEGFFPKNAAKNLNPRTKSQQQTRSLGRAPYPTLPRTYHRLPFSSNARKTKARRARSHIKATAHAFRLPRSQIVASPNCPRRSAAPTPQKLPARLRLQQKKRRTEVRRFLKSFCPAEKLYAPNVSKARFMRANTRSRPRSSSIGNKSAPPDCPDTAKRTIGKKSVTFTPCF